MVLSELFAALSSNPYFSAGFGLLGVGSGMALARQGFRRAANLARRHYLLTMEIPSKDKSYGWVLDWMAHKGGLHAQHTSVETSFVQYENGEVATRVQLVPSIGTHFLLYKGRWIRVERTREKNVVDLTSGNLWESLTLTTIGRNRAIFEDLLQEARQMALQKEEGSTVIYTTSGGDWRRFGFPRKKRPLSSVILQEGQAERVLHDMKVFLSAAQWYTERGIPYRRGYLLYGPPGCGKSSFVAALAGELGLNICILNLNSKGINDDVLNHLLNIAPQRSIVLLEDIDSCAATENRPGNLTFSGLSNALDGVAATEGGGRIIFMTTNYLEKLHPTLIRPGRVDVKEEITFANRNQMERIFIKFFPNENQLAQQFAQTLPEHTLSMAQLQGYLMAYKSDPKAALQNIAELTTPSVK